MGSSVINVRHCWKTYDEAASPVHAVCDVSLSVEHAEFVAITGPSGCGKSTLLNLMGALDSPTSGSICVAGREIGGMSDRQRADVRRRQVSMVFQSFNLLPTMTVLENVALPAYILGRPTRVAHEDALDLLQSVGMDGKANAWPDTLSGGEMQRVALARALINLPDVVLADEPTGNLDRANAAAVMDLLERLTISRGSTLVMVTHSDDAARKAGRIIRMEDGRIVE